MKVIKFIWWKKLSWDKSYQEIKVIQWSKLKKLKLLKKWKGVMACDTSPVAMFLMEVTLNEITFVFDILSDACAKKRKKILQVQKKSCTCREDHRWLLRPLWCLRSHSPHSHRCQQVLTPSSLSTFYWCHRCNLRDNHKQHHNHHHSHYHSWTSNLVSSFATYYKNRMWRNEVMLSSRYRILCKR